MVVRIFCVFIVFKYLSLHYKGTIFVFNKQVLVIIYFDKFWYLVICASYVVVVMFVCVSSYLVIGCDCCVPVWCLCYGFEVWFVVYWLCDFVIEVYLCEYLV